MKQHFSGAVGTLVILVDGLVFAVVLIGLFWFAVRTQSDASAGESSPPARALQIETRG